MTSLHLILTKLNGSEHCPRTRRLGDWGLREVKELAQGHTAPSNLSFCAPAQLHCRFGWRGLYHQLSQVKDKLTLITRIPPPTRTTLRASEMARRVTVPSSRQCKPDNLSSTLGTQVKVEELTPQS